MATRECWGTTSLSNCSRLATSSGPRKVVPVTFPPGRARLATSSSSTGSAMAITTMGMTLVACFGRSGSRRTQCDNDINLAFHQFNSEFAEPIGIRFSKLALNSDVLSFRVTKLAQPYQQRVEGHAACDRTLRAAGREDAYSRYPCSLLRWGGERPHGNQTSDSGDEITALHGGPRFQDKVLFQVNLAQTYKTSLPSRTGHKYVGLRPLGVMSGGGAKARAMSALPPTPEMRRAPRHFRDVPEPDIGLVATR